MRNARDDGGLLRVGVFYDGTFFSKVSNYYLYEHQRKARLSISGVHEFVRDEVAKSEGVDRRRCQIVDSHYFRGRPTAKMARDEDMLYRERQWDDVLVREGVTMHFLPLSPNREGGREEKGIDVWFALEAFELAMYKRFDISVLVTGDGDYVPLVRKLNTLGTRVMLLGWDFEFMRDGELHVTRTSKSLINEVTYPVMMSDEIDSRARQKDPAIAGLFVAKTKETQPAVADLKGSQPDKTARGTILTLNAEKGFGHIRPDSGGENLFFHFSKLLDCQPTDLALGVPVSFRTLATDRGPNAIDVHVELSGQSS